MKLAIDKKSEFQPKSRENQILNLITSYKADGYIRKGNFSTEIIWGKRSFMFPAKKKDNEGFKKGLFLFGMVRKDAKSFIQSGNKIKLPNKYPVNAMNHDFDKWDYRITATDLNHAYWRIAYNLGIISSRTYKLGLNDDLKVVRLASLSTMGAGKDYFVIKNGKVTDEIIKVGGDEQLQQLYRAIRYTCYKLMQQLKKMLRDDFVAYRTDCIYYTDTAENRKLVRDFCRENGMLFKQLIGDKKTLYTEGLTT